MTSKIVEDALEIIEPLDKFFLFMNIGATHRPYDYGETRTDWKKEKLQKYNYEGEEVDKEYLEYLRKRQIESIEFVDGKLSSLLEELENTLTVISSDHGTCFGEGGVLWARHREKRRCFEATQSTFNLPLVMGCQTT